MMFFCVFCVFGSYSANICYSISAKSYTFALEFENTVLTIQKRTYAANDFINSACYLRYGYGTSDGLPRARYS